MSGERSRSSFADDPDVNPDEHEEVQIIAATTPTESIAGKVAFVVQAAASAALRRWRSREPARAWWSPICPNKPTR
jgi:hypothetical protein